MTILISPIEGAQRITKADIESQQEHDDLANVTDAEWAEAINAAQNNENVNVFLESHLQELVFPFRKTIFAIFYTHFAEMINLTTSNLEELYGIFADIVFGIMPERFYYVTGELKAIKSEFDWETNESENLEQLIRLTKTEKEKILQYAPYDVRFKAEDFKDAFINNQGKELKDIKFNHEEANSMINSLQEGEAIKKRNASIIKELYLTTISGVMIIYRFNISHFSVEEINSLRGRLIEDTFDFFNKIIEKTRELVSPYIIYRKVDVKI